MEYKILTKDEVALLAEFEVEARRTEPEIWTEEIDTQKYRTDTLRRMESQLYSNSRVVIALDHHKIVGRCDFVMKGCFWDGFQNAYVEWVYVLKEERHKNVGQGMFQFLETYLKENGIEEYFLVTAHNDEAQSFYSHFQNFMKSTDWILRKQIV